MADQYVKKRSGPKDSGPSAQYSPWYELASDPIPPGTRIVRHQFHLEGDRQCGAWAECKLKRDSSAEVAYEFRLQGHNEGGLLHIGNPNEGVRQSEGVLEIWIGKIAP